MFFNNTITLNIFFKKILINNLILKDKEKLKNSSINN
jgi:hypothetical protein